MTRFPLRRDLLVACATLIFGLPAGGAATAHAACTPEPRGDCQQPFVAHKSTLVFTQTGRTDPDDIYTWKWVHGSGTDVADFGAPLTTTEYALCIYDGSERAQPVVGNSVPPGGGWKSVKSGYVLDAGPRPLRRLVLKAGANGKARIQAHGDSNTVATILPFVAPVVVQLQTNDGGCWETTLPTPKRNDASLFKSTD